jgi:NarL family two-component system response regulator LiaR
MIDNSDIIRIAVVEDNAVFLQELEALLEKAPQLELVGKFRSAAAAVNSIPELAPQVTMIDLALPDGSGVDVIRQLSGTIDTEWIVLTVFDDDQHLFSALKAGAGGYIVKGQATGLAIISAIEEVINGGAPMSLSIARRLLEHFRQKADNLSKMRHLTKREVEVLDLLSKGFSTKKVADMLFISYDTVRCHQKNIYRKLQVHSLVEAVLCFGKRQLP